MDKIRSDTPQALRRLLNNCIQYQRDLRPLFPQVLAAVESLMRSLPKIHHSLSEPILHRSNLLAKELGDECSSPKTPGVAVAATAQANSMEDDVGNGGHGALQKSLEGLC